MQAEGNDEDKRILPVHQNPLPSVVPAQTSPSSPCQMEMKNAFHTLGASLAKASVLSRRLPSRDLQRPDTLEAALPVNGPPSPLYTILWWLSTIRQPMTAFSRPWFRSVSCFR